jgi:hypothetical protein
MKTHLKPGEKEVNNQLNGKQTPEPKNIQFGY